MHQPPQGGFVSEEQVASAAEIPQSVSKKSSKVHTMGQTVAEERLKTPYFIAFCIQQVTRISLTSTMRETF
jgi:hypothetical protein